MSTTTGVPPASAGEVFVHHEVRIEDDDLVARPDQRAEGQHQRPAGAAGNEHLPILVAVLCRDAPAQRFEQRLDALRLRVGVVSVVDRLFEGRFDRRGRVEVGLTDRKVDRIGHVGGQIEDLANAGGIDLSHPVGNPAVRHDRISTTDDG